MLAAPVARATSLGASPPASWHAIHEAGCPLVIEPREPGSLAAAARSLLPSAPFDWRGSGLVDEAVAGLGDIPAALEADIAQLAGRFADLMRVAEIRIRLEGVTTNACRKIHADSIDARLITTYAGPGTEYVPIGMPAEEASLQGIATGWVGLFKGRRFHPEHPFCLHRSPPAGDMGLRRLVLVIDTPLTAAEAAACGS